MLPETNGLLFVGGMNTPFAVMNKLNKELRGLDKRIIECTWDSEKNKWVFMRERTDKSYPNGYKTAEGKIQNLRQSRECWINYGMLTS